jgi:hypothetical protein
MPNGTPKFNDLLLTVRLLPDPNTAFFGNSDASRIGIGQEIQSKYLMECRKAARAERVEQLDSFLCLIGRMEVGSKIHYLADVRDRWRIGNGLDRLRQQLLHLFINVLFARYATTSSIK